MESRVGAAYFKVRYRIKTTNLGIGYGTIGVNLPSTGGQGDTLQHTDNVWANFETGELAPLSGTGGPYTVAECATLQLEIGSGSYKINGRTAYVSEIEVDIYDSNDNLLDTVKPNSDDTLTWDSTGVAHYTEVDQGVGTPNDAKYIYTSTDSEDEKLGLENPSW